MTIKPEVTPLPSHDDLDELVRYARRPLDARYDVAVVGGGPVGCVAAVAFARRGASVLLLEADPKVARRFAGEWLHPPAVDVLDRLRMGRLDGARARTGYGFVLFPEDRSPEIELPYTRGQGLAAEHEQIVRSLRRAAAETPGVTFAPYVRAKHLELGEGPTARLVLERRVPGSGSTERIETLAGRVVGADGRVSLVRNALELHEATSPLAFMAGLELRDVTLPAEGFGHVVLGGPGPALFYRISDNLVRACIDVPLAAGSRARTPGFLWDSYAPVLPESMRAAFRRALEEGPVPWAAIRFRPRSTFGREGSRAGTPDVALVGDTVGYTHPLTALGMTHGFLDCEALAGSGFVEGRSGWLDRYGRERRSYIPEILSNALYQCFHREDAAATEVREAMFRTLRRSAKERARTMEILAAQDQRMRSFSSAFLQIAARAVKSTTVDAITSGHLHALPSRLGAFGEWMQWPAATFVPSRIRQRYRARSTPHHPIPALAPIVPVRASAVPVEHDDEKRARASRVVRADLAMERLSSQLLGELERYARELGTIDDAVLGPPAMHLMRAITSSPMRRGMAARMTIGRRRLAVEGFERFRGASRREGGTPIYDATLLSHLVLVLLDWPDGRGSESSEPIEGLAGGAQALLACEAPGGGFAPTSTLRRADLPTTSVATQAIDALLRTRACEVRGDLEGALARAALWVRGREDGEGSFGTLRETSQAVRILIAAEANPGDASVRRAVRRLAEATLEPATNPHAIALLADVVGALAAARSPLDGALGDRAFELAEAVLAVPLPPALAADALHALALYGAVVAARPIVGRAKPTSKPTDASAGTAKASESTAKASESPTKASESDAGVTPLPAPSKAVVRRIAELDADAWRFCVASLEAVSRTFSKPIELLPDELRIAVTLGYLLCRIADTVEDHPGVPDEAREELFRIFLDVMRERRSANEFERAILVARGEEGDPELVLARRTSAVMDVFSQLRPEVRTILERWVSEMARGMNLYALRAPGRDGLRALSTVEDLDRYCYYVAGTVGHMLTDLFVESLGERGTPELELALREDAEAFAAGLQLVNILKDVTDDLARGVSFVPRTTVARAGLDHTTLHRPEHRAEAHAAVAPLFDRAHTLLEGALRYALAIPADQIGIRLFCLLPLWMAAKTLHVARGNDAMFTPDAAVKISREEVAAIIAECTRLAMDDAALRTRFATLAPRPPEGPTRASA